MLEGNQEVSDETLEKQSKFLKNFEILQNDIRYTQKNNVL